MLEGIKRVLLIALTHQLRLASDAQLQMLQGGKTNIVRSLRWLNRQGWLERQLVVVALPRIKNPIQKWRLKMEVPDFDSLAWTLIKRLRDATPERMTVNWATEKTVRFLGGVGGRLRQPLQIAHDLGVTSVYCRRHALKLRSGIWVSEDLFRLSFAQPRSKIPDAVLLNDLGEVESAIEYGGEYSADRLRAFHRFCAKRGWPYQIW